MITAEQSRAARAFLGWDVEKTAQSALVEAHNVLSLELGFTKPLPETADKLRHAFESAGVEFIAENGGRAGCG